MFTVSGWLLPLSFDIVWQWPFSMTQQQIFQHSFFDNAKKKLSFDLYSFVSETKRKGEKRSLPITRLLVP